MKQKNNRNKVKKNKRSSTKKPANQRTHQKTNNSKPQHKNQPKSKKKTIAEVTCTGLTHEGKGVFEWEGKSLSVDNFLPGEKAEVLISQKGTISKNGTQTNHYAIERPRGFTSFLLCAECGVSNSPYDG